MDSFHLPFKTTSDSFLDPKVSTSHRIEVSPLHLLMLHPTSPLPLLPLKQMVEVIKDKKTGEWVVGKATGAHLCDGPKCSRVFKLVAMKLQKKCQSVPFEGCTPTTWLDRCKPDWVAAADRAAFVDCWNCVNENCDCKMEEMFQSSTVVFL